MKLPLKTKTHILYLNIINLIFTSNLFSQSLTISMIKSATEKIEFGIDYNLYQSIIFQESFITQDYQSYFQNSGVFSPYLSFKSKGFSLSDNLGIYLNSTINYMFLDKQKAVLTDGSVAKTNIDLETSVHYLSLDITPSFFYFHHFGSLNGRNSIIFEFFTGVGFTVYTGSKKEFIYPTKEEFKNQQVRTGMPIPYNFYIAPDGSVAYIGEEENIGFGVGLNVLYGLKIKYNYENMNIHITYKSPFIIALDNYLNVQQISAGVGYSF